MYPRVFVQNVNSVALLSELYSFENRNVDKLVFSENLIECAIIASSTWVQGKGKNADCIAASQIIRWKCLPNFSILL